MLVNYEASRKQFLLIKVKDIDEKKGITEEVKTEMTYEEFKQYFINLNRRARGIEQ